MKDAAHYFQETVTAPANYEVWEQGKVTFGSLITLSKTSAGSGNAVVEARIKGGAVTGKLSGFIQNTIGGFF